MKSQKQKISNKEKGRKNAVNEKVLQAAYGGLIHDIGKPMQRSRIRSDLNELELAMTPVHSKGGYPTHLHAGYTSRFIRDVLKLPDEFESQVSGHHISDSRELASWIQKADHIASAIDRNDPLPDDTDTSRYKYQQVRLASIFQKIDFGKKGEESWFDLTEIQNLHLPNPKSVSFPDLSKSIKEYEDLMNAFLEDVRKSPELKRTISRQAFSRMYGLLSQYMTSVPASTYEGNETFVSLFDHMKLTSAIAACIAAGREDSFRMLEFDISGIQKFIFKITEGSDIREQVAKSLRGRSFLVSLITDLITMNYLHAFGLPESCIIFNTGGGALLLLPDCDDFEKIAAAVSDRLQRELFALFGTSLTYVWAEVQCSAEELERFKTEKALILKEKLELAKSRKFSSVISEQLFYQPAASKVCAMRGQPMHTSKEENCEICHTIVAISDLLVHCADPVILFFFDSQSEFIRHGVPVTLGNCIAWLSDRNTAAGYLNACDYAESINTPWMGTTRFIASTVPISPADKVIPLDHICETLLDPDSYGDPKLGILKMDVDNLGSVFAFGLGQKTRSLSKFLTLSRLLEYFFGPMLRQICQDISEEMNPDIAQLSRDRTMFYINYAGGDDLVILGPAAGILRLAQAINNQLELFVRNPNIAISAGIWIQNVHEPVRFGIQSAERFLERSKEKKGKHSVTLLDTTISYPDYTALLENVSFWIDCIRTNTYSRTGFYRLMKMISCANHIEFAKRLPLISYMLVRNTKDSCSEFKDRFLQRVNALLPVGKPISCREFEQRRDVLILEMKLAIMQTRK